MVIYLPLLFAEGRPTSLEKITISQLERFLPFLLSCCPDSTHGHPPWWDSSVPFKFPLCKSPGLSPQQWLNSLKQLVCKCYEYHKCEHLLRFSARLSQLSPDRLYFKESSSGFISIINRVNDKLIVTFKKRNKDYDQQSFPPTSPFKSLLSFKRNVQPPREQQPIEDIYLCNYCDCEFTSAKDAIAHEAVCEGKGEADTQNEGLDQSAVMRYFGLAPKEPPKKTPSISKRGTSVKLTGRMYMQVPFSSPLGLKMGANVAKLSSEMKAEYINKIESCCRLNNTSSNPTNQTRRPRKLVAAAPRSKKLKNDPWTHTYCFNKAEKRERQLTLKTGLNKRARRLLQKCKKVVVLVERLPLLDPLAIHAAATLFHQYPTSTNNNMEVNKATTICIDLTDSDDENLKENCAVSSSDVYLSSSNHKRPPLHEWSSMPAIRQSSDSVSAPLSSFTSLTASSLLPIPSL